MPEISSRSFGCIFCMTGKEENVVFHLENSCPEVTAFAAKKEKHRTVKGKKSRELDIILPGYVFFEAPSDMYVFDVFPREWVVQVLHTSDGNWHLMGDDERFVRWLASYQGVVGFSKAHDEGGRVKIVSGPLKDMEGWITKVDKRGRSGQVTLNFHGRTLQVWLGFELLDAVGNQIDFE